MLYGFIALVLAILGFIALISGFVGLTQKDFSSTFGSFIIGLIMLIIAYYAFGLAIS